MKPRLRVKVQLLRAGAVLPEYSRGPDQDAGLDLRYCGAQPITIRPGERILCPTGVAMALPAGYEGQVRPRSGLALHQGITVLNSPGTIDPSYRGEVFVLLVNLGSEAQKIEPNERIAQLIVAQYEPIECESVAELDPTERGDAGFGSTGRK